MSRPGSVLEVDFTSAIASAKNVPLSGKFNFSADFTTGTGVGTVQLQRSFDNGVTWKTTDEFTADDESVGDAVENSVRWRLNCSAYTSGTITARISQ